VIEILDSADKILLRLSPADRGSMYDAKDKIAGRSWYANDATAGLPIVLVPPPDIPAAGQAWSAFSFYIQCDHIMLIRANVAANNFTVTIGKFTTPNIPLLDATGNIAAPAKFRVRQHLSVIGDSGATFNGGGASSVIDIEKLIFNEA
jgi:hypothetical protein